MKRLQVEAGDRSSLTPTESAVGMARCAPLSSLFLVSCEPLGPQPWWFVVPLFLILLVPCRHTAHFLNMVKYGFVGIGIMGNGMARCLIKEGHEIVVWNRTASKCAPLVELGATAVDTPAAVIAACEVTFACLTTPQVCLDVVFGENGVLSGGYHSPNSPNIPQAERTRAVESPRVHFVCARDASVHAAWVSHTFPQHASHCRHLRRQGLRGHVHRRRGDHHQDWRRHPRRRRPLPRGPRQRFQGPRRAGRARDPGGRGGGPLHAVQAWLRRHGQGKNTGVRPPRRAVVCQSVARRRCVGHESTPSPPSEAGAFADQLWNAPW
jgi:hypothetical protein